mmetsp:Transcript_9227/g.10530  ORF Transcript_9227/g.10530 Transcript_9227/m.10530 type:complete len:115 (-) Transcript_9227:1354-1698(-)
MKSVTSGSKGSYKRRKLRESISEYSNLKVVFEIDNKVEDAGLVERLPSDILGLFFFGGYVNSLEVARTTSCICKELAELAKEKVTMLDLRRCPLLVKQDLPSLTNRFPNLQVGS